MRMLRPFPTVSNKLRDAHIGPGHEGVGCSSGNSHLSGEKILGMAYPSGSYLHLQRGT